MIMIVMIIMMMMIVIVIDNDDNRAGLARAGLAPAARPAEETIYNYKSLSLFLSLSLSIYIYIYIKLAFAKVRESSPEEAPAKSAKDAAKPLAQLAKDHARVLLPFQQPTFQQFTQR